jgi:hypothetical protein
MAALPAFTEANPHSRLAAHHNGWLHRCQRLDKTRLLLDQAAVGGQRA